MSLGPSRVGFVVGVPWDESGGVQRVSRQRAQSRCVGGDRVFVISPGAPDTETTEQLEHGLVVRRVAESDGNAAVLQWCAEHELDEVQIEHLSAFGLGLPGRLRQLGVTVEWTIHDYHPWCPRGQMWDVHDRRCELIDVPKCAACWSATWPGSLGVTELEQRVRQRLLSVRGAMAHCDAVYMPSSQAIQIAEACGTPTGVLRVRPNLLGAVDWKPNRRKPDPGAVRVGYLGSVQPSKGVLSLARWIAELGAPFILELHGSAGSYHGNTATVDDLMALVESHEHIHWMGSYDRSDLALILAGLDLVCVPSLWNEVYGLVAREAAAAGVPVFVSDIGGLSDAPARVLPAGDERAWKLALKEFAQAELAPNQGLPDPG